MILVDTGLTALGGVIAGSVVAVTLGAFKVIERLQAKKGDRTDFSSSDRHALHAMHDIVAQFDSERIPLVYTPRRTLRLLESQAELARRQCEILERLETKISGHEEREETILTAMKELLERRQPG